MQDFTKSHISGAKLDVSYGCTQNLHNAHIKDSQHKQMIHFSVLNSPAVWQWLQNSSCSDDT